MRTGVLLADCARGQFPVIVRLEGLSERDRTRVDRLSESSLEKVLCVTSSDIGRLRQDRAA